MSHVDTDVSPLPSDLAAESARTWDRPAELSVIPDELRPPMRCLTAGPRASAPAAPPAP